MITPIMSLIEQIFALFGYCCGKLVHFRSYRRARLHRDLFVCQNLADRETRGALGRPQTGNGGQDQHNNEPTP